MRGERRERKRMTISSPRPILITIRKPIITTERGEHTTPQVIVNFFYHLYKTIGFNGCSSHSGRRTFTTNAAKHISLVGGTLNYVRLLAGHSSLATTQRYIAYDT